MGNASSLRNHVENAEKTGVIQLSKSNLRTIPHEIIRISHLLRTIDLSYNRLQELGDNIASCAILKILKLNDNKLKVISSKIGQLEKLEILHLERNLLEHLPNELSELNNLKVLNLYQNKFKVFPKQVLSLRSLEMLDLSQNQIDFIPDEIGQCNAAEINLNNNRISKLNDALKDCAKLKILRLDNNQVELTSISKPILADSKICLMSLENNPFTLKQLQERDGYDQYSERFTSTKRKLM